jgi:hypothetical protein
MPDEESKGPYLTMAVFCENALQETDNVFSAIRIVNTMVVTFAEGAPEDPVFLLQTWMLISFCSQSLAAKKGLSLVITSPSEKETKLPPEGASQPLFFEREGMGASIRVRLNVGVKESGVYWFKIYLDEVFMGQTPLTITLQRTQTETDEKKSNTIAVEAAATED